MNSKISKLPNDEGIWLSGEDLKNHVKSFGNPNYDPETGLSKGKSELTAHTITIGKTSDGMKNSTKEFVNVGKPISILPVELTKEQYDLMHHEYRAHSFHQAFHNHMFIVFGKQEELDILQKALPLIAKEAIKLNCDGVKLFTKE